MEKKLPDNQIVLILSAAVLANVVYHAVYYLWATLRDKIIIMPTDGYIAAAVAIGYGYFLLKAGAKDPKYAVYCIAGSVLADFLLKTYAFGRLSSSALLAAPLFPILLLVPAGYFIYRHKSKAGVDFSESIRALWEQFVVAIAVVCLIIFILYYCAPRFFR